MFLGFSSSVRGDSASDCMRFMGELRLFFAFLSPPMDHMD